MKMRNRPTNFCKETQSFDCDECHQNKSLINSIMLYADKKRNTLTDNKFVCEQCFEENYKTHDIN
jgi:hypothetical protein